MSVAGKLDQELDALLTREYTALLEGNLDALERLSAQKLVVMEAVAALPTNELRKFESFKLRLLRNQRLAQSAIQGMRAAITRAKDIKDVSTRLRTYKKDGQEGVFAVRSRSGLSKRS